MVNIYLIFVKKLQNQYKCNYRLLKLIKIT